VNFGFTKLVVHDLDRMVAFYSEAFGLVEDYRVASRIGDRPIDEVTFEVTSPGAGVLVLLRYADSDGPVTGEVIVGFQVPDMDAAVARAVAAGAVVHREPQLMRRYAVTTAFLTDPEGHLIELVEQHGDLDTAV